MVFFPLPCCFLLERPRKALGNPAKIGMFAPVCHRSMHVHQQKPQHKWVAPEQGVLAKLKAGRICKHRICICCLTRAFSFSSRLAHFGWCAEATPTVWDRVTHFELHLCYMKEVAKTPYTRPPFCKTLRKEPWEHMSSRSCFLCTSGGIWSDLSSLSVFWWSDAG